jgi:hypothetical protein
MDVSGGQTLPARGVDGRMSDAPLTLSTNLRLGDVSFLWRDSQSIEIL